MLNSKEEIVDFLRNHKDYLEHKFGIKKIVLFGSFSRKTQKKNSDLDIMINCQKEYKRYDLYLELKNFLKDKIGRDIEIVYESSMNPIIKIQAMTECTYV